MAWTYQIKPPLGWPLDRDEPINKGLVGQWLNQEKAPIGGRLIDTSGNSNYGTLVADAHSVPGKFGPALDFDGTGDYVDINNPFSSDSWHTSTISMFVKLTDVSSSQFIFDARVAGGVEPGPNIFHRNSGFMELWDGNRDQYVIAASGTSGVWYHWAFVYMGNGVNGKIYRDGIDISDMVGATNTLTSGEGTTLYLGQKYTDGTNVTGQIDHVMIWNRALSAGEVALLRRFPFYGHRDPDKVAVLDQYYAAIGVSVPVLAHQHSIMAGAL